jgi:polyphosphate kinase
VIEALYEASEAGADIDLIVRGICRLRPETPGLSERIRVRSILGRYLEHSRIFAFGRTGSAGGPSEGGRPVRYFIGSADMMPRNLDGRVEALIPVEDPALAVRLQEILDVNLADDVLAWHLGSDGEWSPIHGPLGLSAQARLQELALERAGPAATLTR